MYLGRVEQRIECSSLTHLILFRTRVELEFITSFSIILFISYIK